MTRKSKIKEYSQRIPVFYSPEMAAHFDSFSPSAGKPASVVKAWLALGLPIELIAPVPDRKSVV